VVLVLIVPETLQEAARAGELDQKLSELSERATKPMTKTDADRVDLFMRDSLS
jgi:lipid A disaccharide synthetase